MTKNKATAKKPKTKKPAQVWIVYRNDAKGVIPATATSRAGAARLLEDDDEYIVGPYVLAERVRN